MDGHNIVVFGKKGFGKTTWIKRYIYEHPSSTYLIYDHFHEYDGKNIFRSIDEFLLNKEFTFEDEQVVIFRGEIPYDYFFWLCSSMPGCVAVFDEIDLACSPTYIEPNLYRIIHYGRHLNVGIISASRRPGNVSRNLTSQADEIICFRIEEPRDLKYISDYCGEDIAKKLPILRIGEFVRYPQENAENKNPGEREEKDSDSDTS